MKTKKPLIAAALFIVVFAPIIFSFQNCSGNKFKVSGFSGELNLPSVGIDAPSENKASTLVQNSFAVPFTGNGHNTTWDGRLIVYTTATSWETVVFRPEKVQAQQGVSVDFGAMDGKGAFSQNMGLLTLVKENENGIPKDFTKDSLGTKSIFTQVNALTLAPASGIAGISNPFKSDDNGNPNPTGAYETYDLFLYTQHYGDPNWGAQNSRILNIFQTYGSRVFGRIQVKVVVQSAKTANAIPVRTILVKDFEVIKTSSGASINGIEPSVTADGKLMIFNSNGIGGNGDEIKYIYNNNPTEINNWSTPKNITLLNSESSIFKAQYALARKPILSASGELYSPGESLLGAYPWISWEGSEITFMAAHAHHPVSPARRTGFSVLGRWTGNKIRHIDGSFNKDTKGTKNIRLFTSALGSTSSIWNPMKEVKNPQLPFLFESPSFFMISSNTAEFSEVGFRDFVDGRYEVSLPMNPTLKKVTNASLIDDEFDFNQTADLSQNHLNGKLSGGASFPLETSNGIIDSVQQIGFRGQAIQFPSGGSVVVPNHNVFSETNFGTTFELFVKPISDLSAASENAYLYLIHKPGSMSLILEKNRQLHARITINGKEFSTGAIGTALDLNQWNHVATTHDPALGLFRIFVNGRKIHELAVDQGLMSASASALTIGPGNQNTISQSGFLLHLDEFKFSSVARSSVELSDSAAIPFADRNTSVASLLPNAFKSKDVRVPTEINLATDKVQLGFLLFNDTRLSVNNKISCANCHSANNAFSDPVDFSVGVLGQKLVRHSPVIFNRLFGSTQMWDGRFTSLEQQSAGPLTHPAEMGITSYQALVDKLKGNSSYVKAFQAVYSSEIKPEYIGNALASFQLSLVSATSKYDSYFTEAQITALSQDEIKGKDLFFGKAKCAACHSGPNFTDELYHNTGLFPSDMDNGRGDISHRASESRFYKTPTLRNLNSSAPYMHNGSLQTLEQIVQLYNAGGISDSLHDSEIKPLNLTAEEANQLVLFLRTLNSEIKPIVGFNMSLKNVEEIYPITLGPIDGGWSLWADQGTCTKTCGGGLQSQMRSCTNPAPANGGKQCVGSSTQQIACNVQACPISNDFIVENNKVLKPGEFWGNSNLKLLFQTDGNLVLYKNGVQVLWASNTQKNCPTATSCIASLQADGNLVLYIGTMAYWNTQTYGQGALRLKVTEASPYVQLINNSSAKVWSGAGFDITDVVAQVSVNGGWSLWENQGTCTKACGGGLQNQMRSCTNPVPTNGGASCIGPAIQQVACNTQACEVASNDFVVENNKFLKPGEFWGNGVLKLYFQNDGNLVLYKNTIQVLWASNTQKNCPIATSCIASLQADGNLVLYIGTMAYWNTQTYGQGALRLKVTEASPYVQLIDVSNTKVWSGPGVNIGN